MDAMDEFRAALRKAGAPEGWPENIQRHGVTGSSKLNDKNKWVYMFSCPLCGWERHFCGEEILMISEGDKWAEHRGGTGGLEITGIRITDPRVDVFKNYVDDLDKENME